MDDMQEPAHALARLREVAAVREEATTVLLTLRMDDDWLEEAFQAGARAAVSKTVHPVALGTLLREISHNNVVHRYVRAPRRRPGGAVPAHGARARDPAAGRRGPDERPDRPAAVGDGADRQVPPLQHVPQARAWRTAPRRAATPTCTTWWRRVSRWRPDARALGRLAAPEADAMTGAIAGVLPEPAAVGVRGPLARGRVRTLMVADLVAIQISLVAMYALAEEIGPPAFIAPDWVMAVLWAGVSLRLGRALRRLPALRGRVARDRPRELRRGRPALRRAAGGVLRPAARGPGPQEDRATWRVYSPLEAAMFLAFARRRRARAARLRADAGCCPPSCARGAR